MKQHILDTERNQFPVQGRSGMIISVVAPFLNPAIFALILSANVSCSGSASTETLKKAVAVTFDDAPVMHMERYPSQWHRRLVIDSLTAALERYEAPFTVFAIGKQVSDSAGTDLLGYWAEKGAAIGNHGFNHVSLADMSIERAREEVNSTDIMIREALGDSDLLGPYFRFPFLEEGKTSVTRDSLNMVLETEKLTNSRVTISTDDWTFEQDYVSAEEAEDWPLRYEIGQRYLQHVRESIDHWDALADELYHRPIRHVLMLHANRINRDYLGQILGYLNENGFSFIDLDEAYKDPLYIEPITWASSTGISFLEFVKQSRLASLTASE